MEVSNTKTNGIDSLDTQFSDGMPSELSSKSLLGDTAVTIVKDDDNTTESFLAVPKKKKKKHRTKKNGAKGVSSPNGTTATPSEGVLQPNANVLCISRNKHWKYISSYHGPWLQLPLELLETLLLLNLNPETVSNDPRASSSSPTSTPTSISAPTERRLTGFDRLREQNSSRITSSPYDAYDSYRRSPTSVNANVSLPPLAPAPGKAAPPPIDPGAFRSVIVIRRLIDEAADLSVRASSGLSAAALGFLQSSGSGSNGSPWAAAQALGLNPLSDLGFGGFGGSGGGGGTGNGGRNVPMSATRVHRLRALAVQKLAEAYRADEIASSVMVMQRGTVFDDIAEKVLKVDPKNADARYVHFFHEKIPSRQLAESTATTVLDQLIAENPQRLEFFRTRALVHCFRDEYALAAKDFSYILKESRALRRARHTHGPTQRTKGDNPSKAKRKKGRVNGQAPPDGTANAIEGCNNEKPVVHPSTLPDAPEPIELQTLFLRGSAYFSYAIHLIEVAIFKLEELPHVPLNDFGEMQLSCIPGKYGGTEVNNQDGPLGSSDGVKARAYREVMAEPSFREQVCTLLRKSKRDHEKFLTNFDSLEPSTELLESFEQFSDPVQKMERAFALLETFRPSIRSKEPLSSDSAALADVPLAFTTYHPLMLESYFSILNCLLMLGEFETLMTSFERTAGIVAGLEGYPVFLPPRSMAQAEFVETLERLAAGWKYGKLPNTLVRVRSPSSSANNDYSQPPHYPEYPYASLPVPPRRQHQLLSPSDDDSAAASSSSIGHSTSASASTTCSTKTSPASRRRLSLTEDPDPNAELTIRDIAAPTCSTSASDSRSRSRAEVEGNDECAPDAQVTLRTSLEHLRILLAPLRSRLRTRAEVERTRSQPQTSDNNHGTSLDPDGAGSNNNNNDGGGSGSTSPTTPLSFTLHSARVEVILAWLGAVWLPELEGVAAS